MTEAFIRVAEPRDAPVIAKFIAMLAEYEGLLAETVVDVEALCRQLDPAANPRLHCLIAECDWQSVGVVVYYLAYSTNRTAWVVHVQDLYVLEKYRGRGIGYALLERVAAFAKEGGYPWIQLEVLKNNTAARTFYEKLGAVINREADKVYLDGVALNALAQTRVLVAA